MKRHLHVTPAESYLLLCLLVKMRTAVNAAHLKHMY